MNIKIITHFILFEIRFLDTVHMDCQGVMCQEVRKMSNIGANVAGMYTMHDLKTEGTRVIEVAGKEPPDHCPFYLETGCSFV